MDNNQEGNKTPTAFLVDLVSNRKIPVATPRCRVGRDDLNDIVISGDQSISRFHFIISYENDEFTVQDAKSRHGTFLNGNQLTVSESIKDGDVLKVGVSLFWFVVEGAQSETADPASPSRVSVISESEKAAAAGSKVAIKTSGDMETTIMPSGRSQEMTQEMKKPDAGLIDKLEQAANSIKIDDKPEHKTSLASLLADARQAEPEPEPDKKKDELAALAARDKELLAQMDEEAGTKTEATDSKTDKTTAEAAEIEATNPLAESTKVEEAGAVDSGEFKEDEIPVRPINKPSDTVTLEAIDLPGVVDDASKVETPTRENTSAKQDLEENTATSSQLTSEKTTPDTAGEDQSTKQKSAAPEAEKETTKTELVSREAKSETKQTNAGIINSSLDIAEDIPRDKSSAMMADSAPLGDSLFSPGIEEEAQASIGASAPNSKDFSAPNSKDSEAPNSKDSESPTSKDAKVPIDQEAMLSTQAESVQSTQPAAEAKIKDYGAQSGPNGAGSIKGSADRGEASSQTEIGQTGNIKISSESQDLEKTKFIKAGASAVPDWCKRYFSDEIATLNHELDDLNEQVTIAQQKIRDVEGRVALTRGIRNTLLTTTGDDLVEACGKVLSLLGWQVATSADDKHELRLEVEDKHICIARVIWTTTKAERSHLGQLSISQTRYWMEKGTEPKGIIIVSKISADAPTSIGDSPEEVELNDYAAKRNVCLMSTMQLLSLYKEVALSDASPDKLRTSIVNASGWLAGHSLEPGTADAGEDEASSTQAANKLGSLLSA